MDVKLIPFKIAKGHKPCEWFTEGASYKLGDPELQKKGLPDDVFKRIKATGRIEEITKETKPKKVEKEGEK